MTRFGPSIEPIIFPTPSRCATFYAMDAGIKITYLFYQDFISGGKNGGASNGLFEGGNPQPKAEDIFRRFVQTCLLIFENVLLLFS